MTAAPYSIQPSTPARPVPQPAIPPEETPWAARFQDGSLYERGFGPPRFTLRMRDPEHLRWFLTTSRYEAAMGYLQEAYDVDGDLLETVRFKSTISSPADFWWGLLARLDPQRWMQSRAQAARNIQFHYDRSNSFYQLFLDSRMVYSCAWFHAPGCSLDEAQLAKLDLICRKLRLQRDDSFLDIGCGWGALVFHAARVYGARATGCTLSPSQHAWAESRAGEEGLSGQARYLLGDYRQVRGRYACIASVGMFEHVGSRRLPEYFRRVHALLDEGGLFLNHGIIRPQMVQEGPETLLLQRDIFPGGQLVPLAEVIRTTEAAGFEVLDVENLRPHYALTCRAWVHRLRQNAAACRQLVNERTYRAWSLYLAGSSCSFDTGETDIHQILLAKRRSRTRWPLNRSALYQSPFPSKGP